MWKRWRRRRLDNSPFPDTWRQILARRAPFYHALHETYRSRLDQLVRYFMAEKSFEGCGGLRLTEERRLLIAASACVPVLGGISDIYPGLRAILVYPEVYAARYSDIGEDGVVTEGVESRSGESWEQGVVVLAWQEVRNDLRAPADGANIVYHECAHQLDHEWGLTFSGGWDPVRNPGKSPPGRLSAADTMASAYNRFLRGLDTRRPTPFDTYAATNLQEFFAVMSEYWFERPTLLQRHYPELCEVLSVFYNLPTGLLKGAQPVSTSDSP